MASTVTLCTSVFLWVVLLAHHPQLAMANVILDPEAVQQAYNDVRSDINEDVNWVVLGYEGRSIKFEATGSDYDDMLALLTDDKRCYCYVRFETGDEMSRRAKFAFITWIGPRVNPLKKAKVSTDKAFVKKIWTQFGKEILADEKSEVKYSRVLNILETASGAAYGTGK